MEISMVLGIVAIVIVLLGLFLFLLHDIRATVRYVRATKTTGEIIEKLGEEKFAYYGDRWARRVFGKYRVRYTDDMGKRMEGTVLVKQKDLSFGAQVKVRYQTDENGTILVDDVYVRRLRHFLIALVLGGVLAAFCIYTTKK